MAGLSRPFEAAVMWHFTAGGGGETAAAAPRSGAPAGN